MSHKILVGARLTNSFISGRKPLYYIHKPFRSMNLESAIGTSSCPALLRLQSGDFCKLRNTITVKNGAQTPALPASGVVNYTVDANAFVPGSPGVSDCAQSHIQTPAVSVTAGTSSPASALAFTGCQ